MLGLFFYFLPNVWGKGERVGKEFSFAEGEEERCLYEMYRRAGLLPRCSAGATLPATAPTSAPPTTVPRPAAASSARPAAPPPAAPTAPSKARVAVARNALDQVEQRVGLAPRADATLAPRDTRDRPIPNPASDAQLGLIARLISERRTADTDVVAALNALGTRFGLTDLASLRTKNQLRDAAVMLTKFNAIKLIDALKALDGSTAAQTA